MKNLYAAVVLAIIVFFLSSCGEAEILNVSSEPAEVSSTLKLPSIPTYSSEDVSGFAMVKTLLSEDVKTEETEEGLIYLTVLRPKEYDEVQEGEKIRLFLSDFKLYLIAVKDYQSEGGFLEGFSVIESRYNGETLLSDEMGLEIYTTEEMDALLVKQEDVCSVHFGEIVYEIDETEMGIEVFAGGDGIYYYSENKSGNDFGRITSKDTETYEIEKISTFKVKDANGKKTIVGKEYDGAAFDGNKSERMKFGVLYYFEEEWCNIRQFAAYYMHDNDLTFDDIEYETHMQSVPLSVVFSFENFMPKCIYYDGEPLEGLEKNLEDYNYVDIVIKNGVVLINCNVVEEIWFVARDYWCVEDSKAYKTQKDVSVMNIDDDGNITYRRYVDFKGMHYLNWLDEHDIDSIESVERALKEYFGDEAPDIDEPYFEYGDAYIENGEFKLRKTRTASIRQLYETEEIHMFTACC